MAIDLNELATAIGQLILRFRVRRATAAAWTTSNEVLLDAEIGYAKDTRRLKVGDGTTAWNSLPFIKVGVESIVQGSGVTVDTTDPANPIVSAVGGGAGTYPLPDGCIGWFTTRGRVGVSGKLVNFLSAPMDYVGRGIIASSTSAVYAADLSVATGGTFTINAPGLLTDCTILAVIKTPAALTSGVSSAIISGTGSGSLELRLTNASGTIGLQLVKAFVAAIGDDTTAGSLALSTKMLVGATMTGTAWTLRRAAAQSKSGISTNVPISGSNQIGINGGTDIATHQLYELIIFDRVLGSTDMATAENFLKTTYGL